jgi:hypothetical protein
MEPRTLVVQSRTARVGGLVVMICLLGGGVTIAAGALNPTVGQRALCTAGVLAGIAWMPRYWRYLRTPPPVLSLGSDGIEGGFGFIPWSSVKRGRVGRWYGRRPSIVNVVRLELVAGAPGPRPAHRSYASQDFTGKTRLSDATVEIPAWRRKRAVLDDLRPYLVGRLDE